MKINNIIKTGALAVTLLIGGCGNFLDVDPDDTLLEENSFSNLNEVYSNFLGISTKLGDADIFSRYSDKPSNSWPRQKKSSLCNKFPLSLRETPG